MSLRPTEPGKVLTKLNGVPQYVETLTGAAAQRSAAIATGSVIALQCDDAFYVKAGTSTVTATNTAWKVAGGAEFRAVLQNDETHVSILSVSGASVSVKVFLVE